MKERVEVRSQAEFDACVKLGNIAVVIGCHIVAWGNSSVEAWENSSVVARENSSVVARGNSNVVAWGNSNVVARENSSVVARENSSVLARENSSVEAWENSSVEAWGNSNVVARGNSSVVARGNVFIRLFSALKIKVSAYVIVMRHNNTLPIEGGRQLEVAPDPKTGFEYCEFNGIDKNASFKIPNIDSAIFESIKTGKGELDMNSWHGKDKVNEENWCGTTHCRAGYAICLAGKEGFELEKKYGSELAAKMIYAVSRPDEKLPDFHASDEEVLEELETAYNEVNCDKIFNKTKE
ncbi:MAG: hypothetical protein EBS06_05270 [Proteobacteria bacterium]|nr:hypothetical protein [Pseudomonadota bacterium]